ncbi:hypothetical protein LCGC14_1676620 [marine sediment metagenome]|uniref:Uncharacterized protein n=1 Tax=marine sediment metagenome TaxID=412755 RepID=A0A0F9HQF2_9ZZZZ
MAEKNVSLPALPTGQVYVAILDKPLEAFCKYGGEVNKNYALPITALNAENRWKFELAAWIRFMGTITVPAEGYPKGETRLQHCDARAESIIANTYGYGSGGGGKSADLLTRFLREAVLGVVLVNMPEYKGKKTEAVKAVADDHEAMFLACCEIRHKAIAGSDPADKMFADFWPGQVANAEKRVEEKRAADRSAVNAFDADNYTPAS